MRGLTGDLRVTLRSLRKSPAFTCAVIGTMGLGIAVNAVMFAIADAVLLSPLPYPHPERLTMIWSDGETYLRSPLNGPQLADLRRGSTLHESIAGIWATGGTLVGEGPAEPLRIAMVTANLLPTFRVPPARGRWFTPGDEGNGASPTVVISGELWQRRFGGSDVIGRRVRVDGGWGFGGNSYTIVGVMPVGFEMLLPLDSSVPSKVDAWITFDRDIARDGRGSVPFLRAIGREWRRVGQHDVGRRPQGR